MMMTVMGSAWYVGVCVLSSLEWTYGNNLKTMLEAMEWSKEKKTKRQNMLHHRVD